jgi:hypothetical protein
MDHREASCILYVKIGTLDRPGQSTIGVLTVTIFGILMQTIYHFMMFSICVIYDRGKFLRQSSADILPVEDTADYISQMRDFNSRSPQFLLVNQSTTSGQLAANRRTVGTCGNLKQYAAEFIGC